MKINNKAAIAAAVLLTMTNFSACDNVNQDTYGPPMETWKVEETDTEPVNDEDTPPNDEETGTDNSETTEGDEQQ